MTCAASCCPAEPPSAASPTAPSAVVLIAEDNALNRRLFAEVLRLNGIRAIEAVDGLAALALAQAALPDLILMDIDLPGLSGLEAAQRLRALPLTAAIPVLAISAHAGAGTRERALALGCAGFLSKPVGPDALMRAIGALLPARRASSRDAAEG